MKECIILAGGLGTRLKSVVKDVPKCMAEVAGQPFLSYLFDFLAKESFKHIILALGYKSEVVTDWLLLQNLPFKISYVLEDQPLGTGGAIKLAFSKVIGDNAFVVNGDTFFEVDTQELMDFHSQKKADISIALKQMECFDRYGTVHIQNDGRIVTFNEKEYCVKGLINGGVYLINKAIFDKLALPDKFSFEKDVMEAQVNNISILGLEQDTYFIDIGIPSDFERVNIDFAR